MKAKNLFELNSDSIFRNNEASENTFETKTAENEIVDDNFDEFVPSSSEMEGFRIVKSTDKQKENIDQECLI